MLSVLSYLWRSQSIYISLLGKKEKCNLGHLSAYLKNVPFWQWFIYQFALELYKKISCQFLNLSLSDFNIFSHNPFFRFTKFSTRYGLFEAIYTCLSTSIHCSLKINFPVKGSTSLLQLRNLSAPCKKHRIAIHDSKSLLTFAHFNGPKECRLLYQMSSILCLL